jgi:hypothetical protein
MLAIAGTVSAAPQPLAIPAQSLDVAPKSSANADAYCLAFDRDIPDRSVEFTHVAGGEANVCFGASDCKSLQKAITDKEVAIGGTGTFGLVFHNLTSRPMKIRFGTTTAFTDKPESVELPKLALPEHFDPRRQYEVWRSMQQVGDVARVLVFHANDGFAVAGIDGNGHAVVALHGIDFQDLAKTIAGIAGDSDTLRVDTLLEPRRAHALIKNLHLEGVRRGVMATSSFTPELAQTVMAPVAEVRAGSVDISNDNKEITANLDVRTTEAHVPVSIVVEYKAAQPRPKLQKVRDAVEDVVSKATPDRNALRTGTNVRRAVRDEVRALVKLDRSDVPTVYMIIGDSIRGYLIVQISAKEVASWS